MRGMFGMELLRSLGSGWSRLGVLCSHTCAAPLCREVFDIPVTQVEAIVEPDGVGNDVGRESMTLVCVHELILPIFGGLLGRT